MVFQDGQIKALIELGVPEKIEKMRKETEALKRNFFGTGSKTYLKQIDTYENERQFQLRKDNSIDNSAVSNNLLRPSNNMWTAKGGSKVYKFKDKNPDLQKVFISEVLSDVRGGMDIDTFMKEIWFQRFIADPNGIIFCEVSENGEEFKFTYKDINTILNYKADGIDIEWIIFEPHITIKIDERTPEKRLHWAVDESFYYLVELSAAGLEEKFRIPNSFGFVPGVVNSTIFNTEKNIKESPLQIIVGDLDQYYKKNGRKETHQYLHDFPVYYQDETTCPTCKGMKKVDNNPCPVCNGTGRSFNKDVSDVLVRKKSTDPEGTDTGEPAGYVTPPIEIPQEQRTELDWQFERMFFSLWGTTEKKDNETATGRLLDIQPVLNVLNNLASIRETIEEKLTNIAGKWFNPENWNSAIVKNGRRFVIESADMIWKRYIEAKEKFANDTTLNLFLEQFYTAEFSNDELTMQYFIKLMDVEPYVHKTIDEVNMLAVDEKIKTAKINFPEWVKTKTIFEIIDKDAKQLRQDLYKFKII